MTSRATTFRLPRATPEQHGLPTVAVENFLDGLESAEVELHSLMVLRHGHVLVEGWWEPYTADEVHLLYSLSKSFTSTAVGLAVSEGRLSTEDTVLSFFPQVDPTTVDPRVRRMQVRHLLSMATGHHEDTLPRLEDSEDRAAALLALVPEEEPGTWFTYNNGATLLLSLIMTTVTGERLLEYLRPRLLDPLGIDAAFWTGTPAFDQGFSGLHLTTDSVARFGQLYLQGGVWEGRQLVPAEWVAEATRAQVDNPREPHADWREGYGYQFWRSRHNGYRGDGAYGQFCVVLPDYDTVIVTTAATEDMSVVLEGVWTHLLPAFSDETLPPSADGALAERLSQLVLPLVTGDAEPDATVGQGPWSAVASVPADGGGPGPSELAVTEVRLEKAADASGWLLTLTDAGATYQVPCGYAAWLSGEQLRDDRRLTTAACGAWTGPTTFTAEVAFTLTPHRLVLTCDVGTGVIHSRWRTAPFGSPHGSRLTVAVRR